MSHTAMGRPHPQTESWVRSAFALLSQGPAVRRTGLALVEGGGRRLWFTASDRDRRDVIDWCRVDAFDDVPLNNAIRTGRLITGSLEQLSRRYPEFVARQDSATCALAAVPIVAAGQVMGGFVVFYGTEQAFDAVQLAELEQAGRELGEHLRRDQPVRTPPRRSLVDEPVPDDARVATHAVPAEYRAVSAARRFVHDTLIAWQVDEDVAGTVILCVSELVTNAIIHAFDGCEVGLMLHDDTLTIRVRDGGTDTADRTDPSGDPLAGDGRGLQLVEMVTSRWGSQLDELGRTVWCEVDLG